MNLTQTAKFTKKAIIFAGLGLVLLLFGRLGWGAAVSVYHHFVPPEEEQPQVAFGKLPSQKITGSSIEGEGATYQLDTTTGNLPSIPKLLPVFPYKKLLSTPLQEQQTTQIAENLDFYTNPKKLSTNTYEWKLPTRTLRINGISKDLTLTTDLGHLEKSLEPGSAPNKERAAKDITRFLTQSNLEIPDEEQRTTKTAYLKINNGKFEEATGQAEAQLTRVDFTKKVTARGKDYLILGPDPNEGNIWTAVTNKTGGQQLARLKYKNRKIEKTNSSTYPLKEPEEVWKELLAGKAKVTKLQKQGSDPYSKSHPEKVSAIHIHDIGISYFEEETPGKYLLPIYVFEGIANTPKNERWHYTAYLPAIANEWFQTE
ncbi:MAG: hypothetical protein ACOC6Q_01225 [Patescibacteria group bacterium]